MRRLIVSLGVTIAIVALSGCGRPGTSPTAAASGVVLYKGAPATDVRVIFTPASGRPAIGQTDAEGRFVLTTFVPNDGAVPGVHKATISDRKRNWQPDPTTKQTTPTRFPEKYQSAPTTPWSFEVKSGEDNEFKLEMTD
jgi:hypothetical protein